MHLRKKLKLTLIPLLLCVILLFSASYAWLVLALTPEVTSVETNVGSNGSLEIALLSRETYTDPITIRTGIGESAVVQEATESNLYWGNVIDLTHEGYGLREISLLPSRLNLYLGDDGGYTLRSDMLKTAGYGIDGRITLLEGETVSAVFEEKKFTFHTDGQNYGLRAIGSISNLTSQQIALAGARTQSQSYTTAASRSVKTAWREAGSDVVTLLYQVYCIKKTELTPEDMMAIRTLAEKLEKPVKHIDLALRQGVVGLAASQIRNEEQFRTTAEKLYDTSVPLAQTVLELPLEIPEEYGSWIAELGTIQWELKNVIQRCEELSAGAQWSEAEPLLDKLLDADKAHLGEYRLTNRKAYRDMEKYNGIVLEPNAGILARLAAYCGNYSAFCNWAGNVTVEARTADPEQTPRLLQVAENLENLKAAAGGWTRANLDMLYGYAIDMAFRCNMESELLLQTAAVQRVSETTLEPVAQGGGSYMRFSSGDMDTELQLALMDCIRVGFVDDQNMLIALAKLDTAQYQQQGDDMIAPLCLFDFTVDEQGLILVGQSRGENAPIVSLSQNTPAVLTAVVWLDGDIVTNASAGYSTERSMSGVLNLQFASSADLDPLETMLKNKK